jgi:ubiquitin-conjugating enzyme E2 M
MEFKITYIPEKDSYWYGGKYEFAITIPPEYNISPPKVMCNTRIYHPNIDLKGNVCLNILKDDWRPTLNMNIVLAGLYFLFTDPNPNDPLNHEAATLMRDNHDQFVSNIKKSLKGGNMFGEDFPRFT